MGVQAHQMCDVNITTTTSLLCMNLPVGTWIRLKGGAVVVSWMEVYDLSSSRAWSQHMCLSERVTVANLTTHRVTELRNAVRCDTILNGSQRKKQRSSKLPAMKSDLRCSCSTFWISWLLPRRTVAHICVLAITITVDTSTGWHKV